MIISVFTRIKRFFRTILHAMLGIFAELFLVYAFITAGLVVCYVWWSILK